MLLAAGRGTRMRELTDDLPKPMIAVRGKPIPDWASDFAVSWGQFFLKFLLADERVTAVIPGTSKVEHMTDNLGAMRGRLPNPDERKRMAAFVAAL